MTNTILYALTVLIWGSTWLAIEFQLGSVAPEASVLYRFLIAAGAYVAVLRVGKNSTALQPHQSWVSNSFRFWAYSALTI